VSDDSKFPGWFLWLSEHGVRLLILAVVAGLAFLLVRSRSDTEERLDAIEQTVQYDPPKAYRAPELSEYTPGEITSSDLAVAKSVYVPVYSHIYYDGGKPYLLEATLSIRNTDVDQPLYLSGVRYYDTNGKLSRRLLDELIRLEPLQTIEFLVERRDLAGGSGANFIVDWRAASETVEPPFIEAIMVGRSGTNAISFVSPGRTLERRPDE